MFPPQTQFHLNLSSTSSSIARGAVGWGGFVRRGRGLLVSSLSSRNACLFVLYVLWRFFGIRIIQPLANILAGSISRILLPVHTVTVPSPTTSSIIEQSNTAVCRVYRRIQQTCVHHHHHHHHPEMPATWRQRTLPDML